LYLGLFDLLFDFQIVGYLQVLV
ncbi:hypothetical protein CMV_024007, partial [Castanea mollissima]